MKKWIFGFLTIVIIAVISLFIYLGAPYNPNQSDYIDLQAPDHLVRTIHNPDAGNTVTFLEKSIETDGEYTLLEIDLVPNGGNLPHYHGRFTEQFTAINGTLGIELEGEEFLIEEGDSIKAGREQVHRFFNPGEETVTFQVLIEPGSPGFEKALYMLYGLADDKGIPNNPHHTALFVVYSDTRATGIQGLVLGPFIERLAGRAQRENIEAELVETYYLNMTE